MSVYHLRQYLRNESPDEIPSGYRLAKRFNLDNSQVNKILKAEGYTYQRAVGKWLQVTIEPSRAVEKRDPDVYVVTEKDMLSEDEYKALLVNKFKKANGIK